MSAIQEILSKIDFNIEKCVTQEDITKKILYLNDKENEILKEFKDDHDILADKVYADLYNSIVAMFNNYQILLKQKLQIVLKTKAIQADNDAMEFKFKKLKIETTNNYYKIKLLKYHHRLYKKQKYQEFKIEKQRERAQHKANLAALIQDKLPP